ncbi:hypothetical protein [Leuconostoc lactis]|uniref:hypothetical protein n=1 Tax=Leuconostoc lactis TaxID=1246 RepID=UPI00351E9CC1
MTLQISTTTTQVKPDYVDGQMVLESITVVVNFGAGGNDYFGGQVVLTREDDNVSFSSTADEIRDLAVAKAKALIAASELPAQQVPAAN